MPEREPHFEEEPVKSEKEAQWKSIKEKIDLETDAFGYKIEKEIKDTVIGLNALGINTSQSCEGHVDRGRIAPWVDIQAPNEPKQFIGEDTIYQQVAEEFGISFEEAQRSINDLGKKAWLEAQKILEKQGQTPEYIQWMEKGKEEGIKVKKLVEEFNKDRKVPGNVRITIDESPYDATIHNGGQDYWSAEKDRTEKQNKNLEKRLQKYRTEFKEFAEFLKKKFFKE